VLLLKARLSGAATIWWGRYWSATSRPWRAPLRMLLMRFAHHLLFVSVRRPPPCRLSEHAVLSGLMAGDGVHYR
jgi:hypothetical protein